MDLEGSEFRKKIEIACGKSIVSKQVAIYYDDPRFAANSTFCLFVIHS